MMKKSTKKNPYSVKELGGAGAQPELSAKIGGVGNTPKNAAPSFKKKGKTGSM